MTPTDTKTGALVPTSRQLHAVGASAGSRLPAVFLVGHDRGRRFWEFFTVNIRNRNTRKAYFVAVSQFSVWCEQKNIPLERIDPMHVAAYIEQFGTIASKPTVKQHLAAIRMLFDWLVIGQVMPTNPAHAVDGPKHSVRKGKASVLSAEEMGEMLNSIPLATKKGDPILIGLPRSRTHFAYGLHLR